MIDSPHLQDLSDIRIGYVPYSSTFSMPGDRRRFVYYASKRGIRFEVANLDKEYDLVILTAAADISLWSRYPNAKLVYDLVDSYLAIPRTDLKGWLRGLFKFLFRQNHYFQFDYWKAIAAMCARADAVVCSTEEQRRDISKHCHNVHIILDSHTTVTRKVKTSYIAARPFRLVWEGLPQNLGLINQIRPALDQLRVRHPIELHVVTDRECFRYLGKYGKISSIKLARRIFPDVHFHEWTEADCAEIICSCDLAIIPLDLADPFVAGKPENKLLLFWQMAMPTLTSASLSYLRAMKAAGTDLTVKDETDWLAKLEWLIEDEDARRESGTLGKAYVDDEFSEPNFLARWEDVFASVRPLRAVSNLEVASKI
jgi:glycosyltransferase involved in cell wall biosynthesis